MIIVLFGAILPLLLWPIETFLPYPAVIEELAKAVLVYWILTSVAGKRAQIQTTILAGAAFAFSESMLYLFNILLVGTAWTFFLRLLLTIPLNIITMLVMLLLGLWKRWLLVLGLLAAMLLHYVFNVFVAGL